MRHKINGPSSRIIHCGLADLKRVHEGGLNGAQMEVVPFIGIDELGRIGIGFEVSRPTDHQPRGAWFWTNEQPLSTLHFCRALALLEALKVIETNTLCGVWFAYQNRPEATPGSRRVRALLDGRFESLINDQPSGLASVERKLQRLARQSGKRDHSLRV